MENTYQNWNDLLLDNFLDKWDDQPIDLDEEHSACVFCMQQRAEHHYSIVKSGKMNLTGIECNEKESILVVRLMLYCTSIKCTNRKNLYCTSIECNDNVPMATCKFLYTFVVSYLPSLINKVKINKWLWLLQLNSKNSTLRSHKKMQIKNI